MTNLVDAVPAILDCCGGHKIYALIVVTNDKGELIASSENQSVASIERICEAIIEGSCPVCENLMKEI
jgi:hypothetical protein